MANTSRPAATVPEPSGKPVPSGAIADLRSRISSGVGGRPTPNVGDCAASWTAAASATIKIARIALHLHTRHRPVRVDLPELHSVEVVPRVGAPHCDQRFASRLNVACFIRRARSDDRFPAIESPRQAKARKRDGQPRLLEACIHPTLSSIGLNLTPPDSPAPGPCEPSQLV